MRALVLSLVVLGACSPDIVPGSYFCGPNGACPEDQVCNEADNICVFEGLAEPYACEADIMSEPDDTMDQAYSIATLDCSTLPVVIANCMPTGDASDWVKLTPLANCPNVELDARVSFPLAFEELALEVIEVGTGASVATDNTCNVQGESGDDYRCVRAHLTPGTTYAVHVSPTGEGDCDGECKFTRYTLRIQLGP